ncbi:MAG: hypothetical protein QM758_26705 [Armatimonas sp.]
MPQSKPSATVTFSTIGILMLALVIGSRLWEKAAASPLGPVTATPLPPAPPVLTRITDALKNAPYVERTIRSERHLSHYYWQSGKLISAYAKTGRSLVAYSDGNVWESDENDTRGTIQPVGGTYFSPLILILQGVDFSKTQIEEGTIKLYTPSRPFSTEYTLIYDPKTYLPRSLKEVRLSSTPMNFGAGRPQPGSPPTPAPDPTPTPRPVPYEANFTTFTYPDQLPKFEPAKLFPPRTWLNYRNERARWSTQFAKPHLEFQMIQSKIGVLHVERNEWGDIFLYLAGNYPFGPRYKKVGEQKVKVNCKITIDIDGKSYPYSMPLPIYTPQLPPTFGDRNMRLIALANLSLEKMPTARNFRIHFIATNDEGAVVEKYEWTNTHFAPDFAFAPTQFPPTGITLQSYNRVSSNRIEHWYFQALQGNMPDSALLDRMSQILQNDEKNSDVSPDSELARWRLIQLNVKANRHNNALELAQQGVRLQSTLSKHPERRLTVDWTQVLGGLNPTL